jgi:hypothetical protein
VLTLTVCHSKLERLSTVKHFQPSPIFVCEDLLQSGHLKGAEEVHKIIFLTKALAFLAMSTRTFYNIASQAPMFTSVVSEPKGSEIECLLHAELSSIVL